jgi:hypothetical protein
MDEPKTVTTQLPPGQESWRPEPFPGSDEAADDGCTCPEHQPWPGALTFSTDCPVHELEKQTN